MSSKKPQKKPTMPKKGGIIEGMKKMKDVVTMKPVTEAFEKAGVSTKPKNPQPKKNGFQLLKEDRMKPKDMPPKDMMMKPKDMMMKPPAKKSMMKKGKKK